MQTVFQVLADRRCSFFTQQCEVLLVVQSAHLCLHTSRSGWRQRYFLIEQDDTYGRDPYESLKISHDNLVRMGYADWF